MQYAFSSGADGLEPFKEVISSCGFSPIRAAGCLAIPATIFSWNVTMEHHDYPFVLVFEKKLEGLSQILWPSLGSELLDMLVTPST